MKTSVWLEPWVEGEGKDKKMKLETRLRPGWNRL